MAFEVKIKVDSSEIDKAIRKVNQLKASLMTANELIDSLKLKTNSLHHDSVSRLKYSAKKKRIKIAVPDEVKQLANGNYDNKQFRVRITYQRKKEK